MAAKVEVKVILRHDGWDEEDVEQFEADDLYDALEQVIEWAEDGLPWWRRKPRVPEAY